MATTTKIDVARERAFAECRSLGHEWHKGKPIGSDGGRRGTPYGLGEGMIGIPSHCPNCGTEKVRWITRSGVSTTRYDYPEGYSRHGEERISVQEWREGYVSLIFAQFENQNQRKGRNAS